MRLSCRVPRTKHSFSSPRPHAAPSLPCRLPRTKHSFSCCLLLLSFPKPAGQKKKHFFFWRSKKSTSRLGRKDTYQWVLSRYNISRKHDIVAIWKESRRHGGSEGRNAQFVYRTKSVRHLQKLAVFVCVECVYLNVYVSRCLCLAVFDYFCRLLSRLNADRIAQSYSNQSSHSLGARG